MRARPLPSSLLLVLAFVAPSGCAVADTDLTGATFQDSGFVNNDDGGNEDDAGDGAKDAASLDTKDAPSSDDARATDTTVTGTDTAGDDDGGLPTDTSSIDSGLVGVDSGTTGVDSGKVDSGVIDSGVDVVVSDAAVGTLLISEIQTRGSGGGNDEFVEIYNPGGTAVTFDSTWTIAARSAVGTCTSDAQAVRYTGTGSVIGPHRHFLLTNSSAYDGAVVGDDTYGTGIVDASSVVLLHGATVIDAVCFYFDPATLANLTLCPGMPYTCEKTPVTNLPHDNSSGTLSNIDVSLDRKPGGGAGNGTDTGDNSSDFNSAKVANPQHLADPAAP